VTDSNNVVERDRNRSIDHAGLADGIVREVPVVNRHGRPLACRSTDVAKPAAHWLPVNLREYGCPR
jgi:hypothetical protein